MEDTFEKHRPMMFAIAYRMLGSVMEAEDIVQDAYLRYRAADQVESPRAFLSTVVTRLCLDHLKSARMQRENYVGPWLPEPLLTDEATIWTDPAKRASAAESISMAFLVLLENLTPAERAVFLLREVFDYDYAEIARILDRSESACRKLFSRAKQHIQDNRPRFSSSREEHQQMIARFMQAVEGGELEGLMNLLAEDVTLWSDGGGKVASATRPLHGREVVAKFFLGLSRRAPQDMRVRLDTVNGRSAIVLRDGQGDSMGVITLDVAGGHIQAFRIIRNPDKLTHI